MEKCSHENCDYIADVVTNVHCNTVHGISKREVINKYGAFYQLTIDSQKLALNKKVYHESWKDNLTMKQR